MYYIKKTYIKKINPLQSPLPVWLQIMVIPKYLNPRSPSKFGFVGILVILPLFLSLNFQGYKKRNSRRFVNPKNKTLFTLCIPNRVNCRD